MFAVLSGPGVDSIEETKQASFTVSNQDQRSTESSVVYGEVADVTWRDAYTVDFHLKNEQGERIAWINNYDPGRQAGGFGERI